MAEQLRNNAETTLDSSISDSELTLTVASGLLFPSSGVFRIRIDNEILTVTGVSGTTWTITRGSEGSTASSHTGGAFVTLVLSALGLDKFRQNFLLTGTLASRPSAGLIGRIYQPSDSWFWFRDNGTSWDTFGPQYNFKAPVVADYTWYNQGGTADAVDISGGIHLYDLTSAGANDQLRCLTRTRANQSTGWKLTVAFSMFGNSSGVRHAGVGLFESSGNDVECIRVLAADAAGPTKQGIRYADAANGSPTGLSGNVSVRTFGTAPQIHWIQVEQMSTVFQYRYSIDGITWYDDFTRLISGGNFSGNPDKYFIFVAPYSGGLGIIIHHVLEE